MHARASDMGIEAMTLNVLVMATATVMGACYAHGGRATHMTSHALMAEAREACQRRDPEASHLLLRRLVRVHPSAPEASRARRILEASDLCRAMRSDASDG